jgi:hypothetical protein
LIVTSCDRGWGVIGGTSVGSGASLIVTAGATACADTGTAAGCGSVALMTAQPPNVAASDAAVMNSFTPGALVAGFLAIGLVMVVAVIVIVIFIVMIVAVIIA